jgi:hypothetical protein
MNSLDEHTLVLVLVTLAGKVEAVVHRAVDLLSVSVLLQQTTQDTQTPDPQNLGWHASLLGTASLAKT